MAAIVDKTRLEALDHELSLKRTSYLCTGTSLLIYSISMHRSTGIFILRYKASPADVCISCIELPR
jgi:hypothetical protein